MTAGLSDLSAAPSPQGLRAHRPAGLSFAVNPLKGVYMDFRIETDTMGEMRVANDKLWGSQTQRSLENFNIGNEKMPVEIIRRTLIDKESGGGFKQ